MTKNARKATIAMLVICFVAAAFMTFLYFFPYYKVSYTRYSNVKTDLRLADDKIQVIDSYAEFNEFNDKANQITLNYDEDYFSSKVLLVSIRDGSWYSQSKVTKVSVKDDSIAITYGVENDQNVVGNEMIKGIYYIDLIEMSAKKIAKSDYTVSYIDKVM